MSDASLDPSNAPVVVLGLGASGVAAVKLLRALGRPVLACDDRDEPPAVLAQAAAEDPDLRLHPGGLAVPPETREVILTPGLNPEWTEHRERPLLKALHQRALGGDLLLRPEVVLAAECFRGPLVTIGGTDGKSTTAALTCHLLGALGLRAALGGNSWAPLADVVREQPDAEVLVAEVSAFQMWAPLQLRATATILTNIADDHLDHYPDMETYAAAKLRLASHPEIARIILRGSDPRLRRFAAMLPDASGRVRFFDESGDGLHARLEGNSLRAGAITLPRAALSLPGAHNVRNALAALLAVDAVCQELDRPADAERLAAGLSTFRGLPHRLELVRTRDGVTWRNDSKATNLHASMIGIGAIEGGLVALVGGVDKGLDLAPWIALLRRRCRAVVVMGALRQRFVREAGADMEGLVEAETMEDAVTTAASLAQPGDTVLLTPGASSFDQFASFEARGEAFARAVNALSPAPGA